MIELYKLMVGVNKGVLQLRSQGYIKQKKIVNYLPLSMYMFWAIPVFLLQNMFLFSIPATM